MYELKENALTIFKNEKKSENHPDYKGQINVEGKLYNIALWVKEGKKEKFFSGKISEPYKKEAEPPDGIYQRTGKYDKSYTESDKVRDSQDEKEDGLPW